MAVKTLVSEAEYLAIDEQDGPRYELDEGELVEMSSATMIHNLIRDKAVRIVGDYLDRTHLGIAVSETDFRLHTNLIRRPDLMFFLKETLAGINLALLPIPVVPEFVLEVVSPNDSARYIARKVSQYARAGVKTACFLYPSDRFCVIYQDGQVVELDESGSIEPPSLPGLSIPLADLFAIVPR